MTKFKSKYFYGWNIVFIMAITSSMTMALEKYIEKVNKGK